MTDDLSLLKSAAIAIGGEYIPAHEGYCLSLDRRMRVWNPLMDSGDALELAVRLHLNVCSLREEHLSTRERRSPPRTNVYTFYGLGQAEENHGSDPLAATRRAIVRAAAALGAAMEGKQ